MLLAHALPHLVSLKRQHICGVVCSMALPLNSRSILPAWSSFLLSLPFHVLHPQSLISLVFSSRTKWQIKRRPKAARQALPLLLSSLSLVDPLYDVSQLFPECLRVILMCASGDKTMSTATLGLRFTFLLLRLCLVLAFKTCCVPHFLQLRHLLRHSCV